MKSYAQEDLSVCVVKGCRETTFGIVLKGFNDLDSVLYGYCQFHLEVAEKFFHQPNRKLVKGVSF
jgi:hypothetical protein